MRALVISVVAALVAAAALAASAAQAAPPDVCVPETHHHVGEVCASQVDDIAVNKAECLQAAEDKTDCGISGVTINDELIKEILPGTSVSTTEACIQIQWPWQGCLTDVVPRPSAARSSGPCIVVDEQFECIDPQQAARAILCPIGEKLGWYCLDVVRRD